jgi:hypothetical protein
MERREVSLYERFQGGVYCVDAEAIEVVDRVQVMASSLVRPNVADLTLRVFDRQLHPELFAAERSFTVNHKRFVAQAHICNAGHVLSFQCNKRTCTEVLADRGLFLPDYKLTLEHRFKTARFDERILSDRIRYSVATQLERLSPSEFQQLHEEMQIDCLKAELAMVFPTANRLAPSPLSVIRLEATLDGLIVHAFHTYPEYASVVKSQSLFELP